MTRSRNSWGDENREEPAGRRRDTDSSALKIVALVLGGAFLVCVAVCGGLFYLGYLQANKDRAVIEEQLAAQEQAEAQRQADMMARRMQEHVEGMQAMQDAIKDTGPGGLKRVSGKLGANPAEDHVPPPRPGTGAIPDPPPQPKTTTFASDKSGDPSRWRVLFRSKKPELWNTFTNADDDFALPLRLANTNTRFLRLRRMDTGEAIILPFSRDRIGQADNPPQRVRWNGEGKDEHGNYHLGIAEGATVKWMEGKGTIAILMDGFDANPGSGFGHAHHMTDGGQRYSWLGKEIPPTAFEIAVTAAELTDIERKWLRD